MEEQMQAQKQITNEPSVIHQNRQFILGVALISIILFAYYAYTWRNAYNFRAAMDVCSKPFCDLADYYYPMGETIFQTKLPIEGFVYSPFIAILLAALPPLGLDISLLFWGILQILFVILYLFAFRQLVPAKLPFQLLFVTLVLSSFPLLHNFKWGQVGVFTTVSILYALIFLERNRHAFAAAFLAFAASFKFFPLIFLAPFIFRRDLRFLLYAILACGVFLLAVPCLLLGIDGTLNFYSALLDSYRHFDWVITNYNSQHFPHVLLRWMEAIGFDVSNYLPLLRWTSYGITLLNMGLILGIQRARLPHADLWSFHLIFLSIPFFLMTSWPVDLVYLPFAQALLAWKILEGDKTQSWKHPLPARKAASLLLLVSIVISNIVFFNLIGNRSFYGSVGFIFWADFLLLVVSYMELLPSVLQQIRAISSKLTIQGR
ncbi:MAG: DUF2029 domain-containing protein [Anaerolineae bacterium]|nr:DUF2029 domain-containing protein [Anaerolineae bacterium]